MKVMIVRQDADAVISLPVRPCLYRNPILCGTSVGYYAACAIDEEALIFRGFRNDLNLAMARQVK